MDLLALFFTVGTTRYLLGLVNGEIVSHTAFEMGTLADWVAIAAAVPASYIALMQVRAIVFQRQVERRPRLKAKFAIQTAQSGAGYLSFELLNEGQSTAEDIILRLVSKKDTNNDQLPSEFGPRGIPGLAQGERLSDALYALFPDAYSSHFFREEPMVTAKAGLSREYKRKLMRDISTYLLIIEYRPAGESRLIREESNPQFS